MKKGHEQNVEFFLYHGINFSSVELLKCPHEKQQGKIVKEKKRQNHRNFQQWQQDNVGCCKKSFVVALKV